MISMRKFRFGIILVIALLAIVSVASAAQVTANIGNPGSNSYWDIDVTSGTGILPAANDYLGWCGNSTTYIDPANNPFTFDVYSSLSPGSLPSYMPTMD